MAEFASKGVAGTALGLGIAGTALGLGVLNGNGDGLFNLGGNKNCGNAHVTEKEMSYIQQLNAERAKLAEVTAERYADGIGIATYKEAVAMSNAQDAKFGALLKDVTSEVVRLGQESAVLKADIRCLNSKVDYENVALNTKINTTADSLSKDIAFTNKSLMDAVSLESERRACGDEKVVAWVQSQDYIKGVIKIDGDQICCGDCSPCNKKTS